MIKHIKQLFGKLIRHHPTVTDGIELRKEDFDSLKSMVGNRFMDIHNCPIARAMTRHGYKNVSVCSSQLMYTINDTTMYLQISGNEQEVDRCRQELLNGADAAYIKVNKK